MERLTCYRLTGLYFNNERYYDKDAGRYTQPDPVGLAGGIDGYTYVANNPLNAIDPDGTQIVISIPRPQPVPVPVPLPNLLNPDNGLMHSRPKDDTCPDTKTCPACTPYPEWTIGYLGPHTDHDHWPIGRPHLNLFRVNQNKTTCKCFWNKNYPDVVSPPPSPNWVDLNNGFPPLSP